VNARRSWVILFALVLMAPWVAPADPCAPVCECCPRCASDAPAKSAPCHGTAPDSAAGSRRGCTDCLKAAPGQPDGVLQTLSSPPVTQGPFAILPPEAGPSFAPGGRLLNLTESPPPKLAEAAPLVARAPPFSA